MTEDGSLEKYVTRESSHILGQILSSFLFDQSMAASLPGRLR
jgi:hypothetical protein